MKRTVILISLLASFTSFAAEKNSDRLRQVTWQTSLTESNLPKTLAVDFSKEGSLTTSVTCHFSQIGLGGDVTASLTVPVTVTESQVTYPVTKEHTVRDGKNWCSAHVQKGFSEYLFLDDQQLLIDGRLFTARDSNELPPPAEDSAEGSKWTFSFNKNGIALTIVQDLTVSGKLTTKATCHLPSGDLTVSVNAPVVVTPSSIMNPQANSDRKSSPDGSWCMAIIPKREMSYKFISADQIKVDNDPLHPEGIVWQRVR